MNEITVFIENNKKDLYLYVCIKRSMMTLKNAAVYWKYKNVISGINDFILYGSDSSVSSHSQKIMFGEGYWIFDMIKDRLKPYGITLTRITHNNKCKISSVTHVLNLDKFALLLGFPERQIINSTLITSPNVVNINQDLSYININCDLVDTSENSNTNGQRSYTLATLPIPSELLLNSTVTYFRNIDSRVVINNGCFNRLSFDVDTNINKKVDMNLLLELYID